MNEEEHRLYMRKMKERSRQKKKDLIAQKKVIEAISKFEKPKKWTILNDFLKEFLK